ncbi:uncharacterized protein IUM83_01638 [Phytophthora cinnamomi]|uniref:uncharacterized protein n=1 Tax=Phytophthora cinnamomi TaxID=4785 RepID=UPI00355A5949|nr:hypothetical protein IUM83_01638 [Phytophthora cinnamomi]
MDCRSTKPGAGKPSGDYILDIDILRFRVVIVAVVMASAFTSATLLFAGDGIQVSSFRSGELDAAGQKELLDKYNGRLGSLIALVMKPLDAALSMVIAVVFLCLATKWSVYHENRCRYLMMAVIGVVGYLMNTGFNSLNLQVVLGKIRPRIISSDLTLESVEDEAQKLDDVGFLTTTMNTSFRENVPATYGFPSRSWQERALSKALDPTGSVSMPMNAATSELPSDDELPMNVSVATNLAVYAMVVSDTFLGWWGIYKEVWGPESYDRPVNNGGDLLMADYLNLTTPASGNATFLSNLHEVIVDYFEKAENASTTDDLAKMEFSHVDLSETVAFDAFTIEIPTQKLGIQEDNSSFSNPFYKSLYAYTCNTKACIVSDALEYALTYDDSFETTIYPRIQALAICLNDAGGEELTID